MADKGNPKKGNPKKAAAHAADTEGHAMRGNPKKGNPKKAAAAADKGNPKR